MNKVTIFDAAQALAYDRGWDAESTEDDVVPFEHFWKLCIMGKISSSDRKIKELWNAFVRLGVAVKVNNRALRFEMGPFKTLMATEYPRWRVKP